jgi:chromatin assembly factor 1 subunit B
VLVYNTESIYPMAVIGNIHYQSINDMAWDGNRKLVICSSDGFCSVATFEGEGENNMIG